MFFLTPNTRINFLFYLVIWAHTLIISFHSTPCESGAAGVMSIQCLSSWANIVKNICPFPCEGPGAVIKAEITGLNPTLALKFQRNKKVSSQLTCNVSYCGEPLWPRGSVLRPPGIEFWICVCVCVWRAVSSHSSHHFIIWRIFWSSFSYICTKVA